MATYGSYYLEITEIKTETLEKSKGTRARPTFELDSTLNKPRMTLVGSRLT